MRRRWHGPPFWMSGHRPPRIVRRAGCAFAALIVFAAIGSSALARFFARVPPPLAIVIALFVVLALFGGFAITIRRVAAVFREQDRLRRQMMADVAHELRTPLSILQGRIEGLIDGVYARDDSHLNELLAETQHLSRLVEDVRTLANAEAGALDLRKERIDPADLIREAAAAIGTPVELDVPEELPLVEVDPVRIREVLLNLLFNAVEHAPEGRVGVSAAAEGRMIVIRVHDDGGGIPADELPRLFDRFHKGRTSHGSGLGLSIARKLVLAHGGTISVESVAGSGTTFTVSIPRS